MQMIGDALYVLGWRSPVYAFRFDVVIGLGGYFVAWMVGRPGSRALKSAKTLCVVACRGYLSVVFTLAALAIVIGIAILAASHPRAVRPRIAHAARSLGLALWVMWILTAGPLMLQFLGAQRLSGAVQPSDWFVNDLLNFVLPTGALQFSPDSAFPPKFTTFSS